MDDEEFIKWFKATLFEAVAKEFIAINSNNFVESEHPRDKDGKFTKKGGGHAKVLDKKEDGFAKEIKDYPGGGYTNPGIKCKQARSFQVAMDEFAKYKYQLKTLSMHEQILIFELLMRGYNINQRFKMPRKASTYRVEDGYTFVSNGNYRNPKVLYFKNKDEAVRYLNNFVVPKARYLLAYSDKNSTLYDECEIVEVFKNAEHSLRFFNVKQQKIYDESLLDKIKYAYKYNGEEKFDNIQLFRVDNQEFNPKVMKKLLCKKIFQKL